MAAQAARSERPSRGQVARGAGRSSRATAPVAADDRSGTPAASWLIGGADRTPRRGCPGGSGAVAGYSGAGPHRSAGRSRPLFEELAAGTLRSFASDAWWLTSDRSRSPASTRRSSRMRTVRCSKTGCRTTASSKHTECCTEPLPRPSTGASFRATRRRRNNRSGFLHSLLGFGLWKLWESGGDLVPLGCLPRGRRSTTCDPD